jgi:hypothetical protein
LNSAFQLKKAAAVLADTYLALRASLSRVISACKVADALIDFLHGKVFETLSDLARRRRLPWRRAEDLIVISTHGGPLRLVAKAENS